METETRVFRLSFVGMLKWCGKYLLYCTVGALALALLIGIPLFFLSKLPLNMFMTPVVLGVIPVGLLFAFFGPMILGICFFYSYFIRYELNEFGIVQVIGPIRHETQWLEMKRAERETLANIEVLNVELLKKTRPLTIYASFLEQPEFFAETVLEIAPNNNPMRQLIETRDIHFAEVLEENLAEQ